MSAAPSPRTCAVCEAGYAFVKGRAGGYRYCSQACAESSKRHRDLGRSAVRREARFGLVRTCEACKAAKSIHEFGRGAVNCRSCQRTPQARRAERARIAANHGRTYLTRDEREQRKARRIVDETARRVVRRLLRVTARKSTERLENERRQSAAPIECALSSHPSSVAYRNRYATDPTFRLKALIKSRARRLRASGRVVEDDGTVPGEVFDATECPYCGCELSKTNTVLDHMQPLALGGKHTASNVIACCWTCNAKKGAKPWGEWAEMVGPQRARAALVIVESRTARAPDR